MEATSNDRRARGWERAGPAGIWLALSTLLGCQADERPRPLSDLAPEDARLLYAGSFHAPSPDAGDGRDSEGGSTEDGLTRLRQTYEGACAASMRVQWGFFTYDMQTPEDSAVTFRLRTGASEDELARADFVDLITASAALGTQHCRFSGPAPCPIDLFEVLGGAPRVHHLLAELEVVLIPSSAAAALPSIDAWQLNYSCSFNE